MDASRDRRTERGQILVVFAGSLILLLLIAGLVFDLGVSWMMRRQEQNAVDPGAIAAAQYIPGLSGPGATPQMVEVACFYARQNGFFPSATTNDGCVPINDPGRATLTVNYPPAGGSAGAFEGRLGFVQVSIIRHHANFFLPIIGQPTSMVGASAVAARTTGNANSNSLIALDPTSDCATGMVQGTTGSGSGLKVTVGGNVYVNSTCGGPVDPPTTSSCLSSGSAALKISGGGGISAPQIYVNGTCALSGTGSSVTTNVAGNGVNQGAIQIGDPLAELRPPIIDTSQVGQSCGGGPATDAKTNNMGCGSGGLPWTGIPCAGSTTTCVTLSPGVYYGGWAIKSGKYRLLLNPGIYIMAGGGITQTGGTIDAVNGGSGSMPGQVMIFSADNPLYAASCASAYSTGATIGPQCQSGLGFTAQSTLNAYGLGAATCTALPATCPYQGILLWQDGHGSCPTSAQPSACMITVGGGTNITIAGTIYAPSQLVNLDGSALAGNTGTATVQIISWAWKIVGNSTLNMPYDANQLYRLEQRGLVH